MSEHSPLPWKTRRSPLGSLAGAGYLCIRDSDDVIVADGIEPIDANLIVSAVNATQSDAELRERVAEILRSEWVSAKGVSWVDHTLVIADRVLALVRGRRG